MLGQTVFGIGKLVIGLHNTQQMMIASKILVHPNSSLWFAITALLGLLQGCAAISIGGYGPDRQSRDAFEHRVEAAFRLQNKMTSEVMALQSNDEGDGENEAVFAAEQIMQRDCSYLNEYASRDMDGLSKGFLLLKHVENSVVSCEKAAHDLQSLLHKP